MMLCMWNGFADPWGMLGLRGIALLSMVVANVVAWGIRRSALKPLVAERLSTFFKILPTVVMLIWWYPDIYQFCQQFPYLDHVFAGMDQTLFGLQPALAFELAMPQTLWSELFCLGYYVFYYMMAAVILFYLLYRYDQLDRIGFIFLGSFFLMYFIYEFLPVAGPQFYFCALLERGDITSVEASSSFSSLFADGFPQLGDYFRTHREMITPEVQGVFGNLVVSAHEMGERPIAAFPSSHVGISTILMMLAWRSKNKPLFWIMFPLYVLLCCGTVYIKAHYLVDSIAGFFTAILFYYLTDWIYSQYRG